MDIRRLDSHPQKRSRFYALALSLSRSLAPSLSRSLARSACLCVSLSSTLLDDETRDKATIQEKDPKAPNATLRWSGTSHMLTISTGTHTSQHACTVGRQSCQQRGE
eukprot:COSAG03_NODE_2361_length_2846_cov_5.380779_3_plen_107_part_00